MKKTTLTLMASLLVTSMLAVPVWAGGDLPNPPPEKSEACSEVSHEESPMEADEPTEQPRAALCQKCLNGQMVYSTTEYGNWHYIGDTPSCMSSEASHPDKWYVRTVTKVYQCTYCGVQDLLTSEQNKYVCTQ